MVKMDVDFDVWKAIQAERQSENDSESGVIRRFMKLDAPKQGTRPWITKYATFHNGTPFRAVYKSKEYLAEVVDGQLEFRGKRYNSPSTAASEITGGNVNGWNFWKFQYQGDDQSWHSLKSKKD